jgi:hypothetical protein
MGPCCLSFVFVPVRHHSGEATGPTHISGWSRDSPSPCGLPGLRLPQYSWSVRRLTDRDDRATGGRPVRNSTVRVAFFSPEPPNLKATFSFCVLPTEQGREHGIEGSVFSAPAPRLHDYIWRLWA